MAPVLETFKDEVCVEDVGRWLQKAQSGHHAGTTIIDLPSKRIGGMGELTLLGTLFMHCPALRSIRLPGNDVDDEGAKFLAQSLRMMEPPTRLSHIDLSGNRLTATGACAIARAFMERLHDQEPRPLEPLLDLSDNRLEDHGVSELARLLEGQTDIRLRLRRVSCTRPGLNDLLKYKDSLSELDLSSNPIGTSGTVAVCSAAVAASSWHTLGLAGLRSGDAEQPLRAAPASDAAEDLLVDTLVGCVRNSRGLTSLDLSDNALGDRGCAQLVEALRDRTSHGCAPLRRLSLSSNACGPRTAQALQRALAGSGLRELRLEDNALDDEAAEKLADGLARSTTLEKLYLSRNGIGDKGVEELAKGLKSQCTTVHEAMDGVVNRGQGSQEVCCLRDLWLSGNPLGDRCAKALASAASAVTEAGGSRSPTCQIRAFTKPWGLERLWLEDLRGAGVQRAGLEALRAAVAARASYADEISRRLDSQGCGKSSPLAEVVAARAKGRPPSGLEVFGLPLASPEDEKAAEVRRAAHARMKEFWPEAEGEDPRPPAAAAAPRPAPARAPPAKAPATRPPVGGVSVFPPLVLEADGAAPSQLLNAFGVPAKAPPPMSPTTPDGGGSLGGALLNDVPSTPSCTSTRRDAAGVYADEEYFGTADEDDARVKALPCTAASTASGELLCYVPSAKFVGTDVKSKGPPGRSSPPQAGCKVKGPVHVSSSCASPQQAKRGTDREPESEPGVAGEGVGGCGASPGGGAEAGAGGGDGKPGGGEGAAAGGAPPPKAAGKGKGPPQPGTGGKAGGKSKGPPPSGGAPLPGSPPAPAAGKGGKGKGPGGPPGGKGGPPPAKAGGKASAKARPSNKEDPEAKAMGAARFGRRIHLAGARYDEPEGHNVFNDLDEDLDLDTDVIDGVAGPEVGRGPRNAQTTAKRKEGKKVLDLNRAQSIAIMLSRLPVAPEELCDQLRRYELADPRMDPDSIGLLMEQLPTKEEIEKMMKHEHEVEELRDVEQKVFPFVLLPKCVALLRLMKLGKTHSGASSKLYQRCDVLRAASEEVRGSRQLRVILRAVLKLVNYINHGTKDIGKGTMRSFPIESLNALATFKVGQASGLQILAFTTRRASSKFLQGLKQSLGHVQQAAKEKTADIKQGVHAFSQELAFAQGQVARIEGSSPERERLAMLVCEIQQEAAELNAALDTAQGSGAEAQKYFGIGDGKNLPPPPEDLFGHFATFLSNFESAWLELDKHPFFKTHFQAPEGSDKARARAGRPKAMPRRRTVCVERAQESHELGGETKRKSVPSTELAAAAPGACAQAAGTQPPGAARWPSTMRLTPDALTAAGLDGGGSVGGTGWEVRSATVDDDSRSELGSCIGSVVDVNVDDLVNDIFDLNGGDPCLDFGVEASGPLMDKTLSAPVTPMKTAAAPSVAKTLSVPPGQSADRPTAEEGAADALRDSAMRSLARAGAQAAAAAAAAPPPEGRPGQADPSRQGAGAERGPSRTPSTASAPTPGRSPASSRCPSPEGAPGRPSAAAARCGAAAPAAEADTVNLNVDELVDSLFQT